tara:strand:+ start:175 stop:525 length:351 start_codon:yes stop_codon:yes gene_type:complete
MTQKEILENVLNELLSIKKDMPNGEFKALVEDVKDMKEDLTELKYTLLNPEDGVIVKTNQNTNFRHKLEANEKDFQASMAEIDDIKRWKDGVTKALWIIFAALAGIVIRMLVMLQQ